MKDTFKAVKIFDDVYWVGAIDWDIRHFHGYLTSRGTTYNAFLILTDKVTLIDTVKASASDEMFARIASVIDPEKIDYIVSNHAEMDHSGALPEAIKRIQPEKVFATKMGAKALGQHFDLPCDITIVGDGETLDLGSDKITFAETKMCHWPDSMVTYQHGRQILYTQDAFGMHLAGLERYADEYDQTILDYEATKYYANILMHLAGFIDKTLEKLTALNLDISMIAPDHGPIWRTPEDIAKIIGDYSRWSAQKPTDKVVVVYDSMWGSTAKMARAIGEGLSEGGVKAKLMSMSSCHRSDVVTEILDAGGLVVGSATMNNNMQPAMADVTTYAGGLKPRNLVAGAFGSYGWSGEASKNLQAWLEGLGLNVITDPLRVNYVPNSDDLATCRQFGIDIAKATLASLQGNE
ncbi:MAG: FprA family A-type flavoprotein [Phycisphaerales bacterium]|jgi:flavorubredoxin|nr:FprA family A-type flavoprotein [Phycisphaerales bacterium]